MSRAPLLSKPFSTKALSSILIRRPNGIELPIFYTSHGLQDAKQRYSQLEKLAYVLVLSTRKLRPYFQAHVVDVLNNQPLRQVLQKPKTSKRLIKWAIKLGEFDIHYHPRPAEKGQAVVDLISELTLPSEGERLADPISKPSSATLDDHPTEEAFNPIIPYWTLYVDNSSNRQGSGAGLVLKAPDQTTIEYAILFPFCASNNEAEYEALLAGL